MPDPPRARAEDAQDFGRHYRGEAGATYFRYQRPIGEFGARLNRWKFLPHLRPTGVVVDFGCGGGGLLANLPAVRRIGIEVSPHARAVADARGLETVASARELPDDCADTIVSNHALEHTLNPLDELRQLRRILRPGGKLILWLPLEDWRNAHHRLRRPDPNHHLYGWTPLLMRNLLAEAGFAVEECRVISHAWPPYTQYLSRLPQPIWHLGCRVFSRLARRRQLTAVARPGPSDDPRGVGS